ncbi:MAG TPA: hypothetical protein DEP53_08710 [Bacteroidetes bacterium]|nr:hypothetical protein [Bacteroidota bacterium]
MWRSFGAPRSLTIPDQLSIFPGSNAGVRSQKAPLFRVRMPVGLSGFSEVYPALRDSCLTVVSSSAFR